MNSKRVAAGVAMLCVVGLPGCKNRQAEKQSATAPQVQMPIDPATAASVSGTVSFSGEAPKPVTIDMSLDPNCKGTNEAEAFAVNGGKLANVFVYVKEGFENRAFQPPPEPVTLTQEGCRYRPHVLGIMVGQKFSVVNGDPTTHNVHPAPAKNEEWNESQGPHAAPLEKAFSREELMLPITCNEHPWMKMYVNVVKSPFYAVTGTDGKYEIRGLPPGDYTIAFVHEKLGERTVQLSLAPKDHKTADATFQR